MMEEARGRLNEMAAATPAEGELKWREAGSNSAVWHIVMARLPSFCLIIFATDSLRVLAIIQQLLSNIFEIVCA